MIVTVSAEQMHDTVTFGCSAGQTVASGVSVSVFKGMGWICVHTVHTVHTVHMSAYCTYCTYVCVLYILYICLRTVHTVIREIFVVKIFSWVAQSTKISHTKYF